MVNDKTRQFFKKDVHNLCTFFTATPAIKDIVPNFNEMSKVSIDFKCPELSRLLKECAKSFEAFLNTLKKVERYTETKSPSSYTV